MTLKAWRPILDHPMSSFQTSPCVKSNVSSPYVPEGQFLYSSCSVAVTGSHGPESILNIVYHYRKAAGRLRAKRPALHIAFVNSNTF